eukprot:TRINITY_DN234_c1_g1_i1.p1 TRINITY_DN234_c1_g1~~TRINITY_DN234_c1_g1_i1.p1  ORF type:complete len:360 (-),score=69.73 TRINITY_DN234_c1_g1_i1:495-1574(-)
MSDNKFAGHKCEACGKDATLQCPTCIKKGAEPSYFCSQTCFKENWNSHKKVHKAADIANKAKAYVPPKWHYTGPLRPAFVTPRRPVPDHIKKPDYAELGIPLSEREDKASGNTTIRVYTEEEIEKMRKVCRFGREVLDAGAAAIRVGVTTDEIDAVIHQAAIDRDCYPSPLNYVNFPKSVCTSVNEVICHGIPDMRPLEDGDIVNLDVSVYHDGFHADLNETYTVGEVDEESKRLIKASYDSLQAAIAIVKPGTPYRDVGKEIEKLVKKQGFSVVTRYCGHGIGELFHTGPNVPHYASTSPCTERTMIVLLFSLSLSLSPHFALPRRPTPHPFPPPSVAYYQWPPYYLHRAGQQMAHDQ